MVSGRCKNASLFCWLFLIRLKCLIGIPKFKKKNLIILISASFAVLYTKLAMFQIQYHLHIFFSSPAYRVNSRSHHWFVSWSFKHTIASRLKFYQWILNFLKVFPYITQLPLYLILRFFYSTFSFLLNFYQDHTW